MLRNIGIRSKILAVLALPVAVLLLAAGIFSAGAVSDARRAAQVEVLAGQAADLSQLVRGLQAERALSAAVLSGNADARPQLEEVRGRISAGLAEVRDAIDGVELDLIDPAAAEAVGRSEAAHNQIESLRAQVDAEALTASAAQTAYTDIIVEDIALPGRIGDAVTDKELASHLRAYTTVERLAEAITNERDFGVGPVAAGGYTPEALAAMTSMVSRQDVTRTDATTTSALVGARVPALGYELQLIRQKTVLDPDGVIDAVTVDDWRTTLDKEVGALDSTLDRLATGASVRAAALADDARTQAIAVSALAVALVVLPLLIALFIARGITRPLRRLTEAAGQVRNELPQMVERMQTPGEGPGSELPEIPVESNDELGRLAVAFNDVNATTVQVAREQAALRGSIAAMFVNVARRDQVLLSRQLAFIDQLERTEENPATLDNLFRLDHLATRMRRNAESLLVLAGIDTGRRLRRPMPLSDVIRTASSEIEHYERIDLALRVDPPMVGHVSLTAAHLLAELLENATNFSDPGSRVVVSTGTGPRGIVVTITDDGLGMSPEDIADANTRIADPPVSEVVGSQRLGFFVVGRLARKLDAVVSLRASRGRGTVVTIELSPALFTPGTVVEMPAAPAEEVPEVAPDVVDVPATDEAPAPDSTGPRALDGPSGNGSLPRRGSPTAPRITPPAPVLRPADSQMPGSARTSDATSGDTGPLPVVGGPAADLPLPRRSRGAAEVPVAPPVDTVGDIPADHDTLTPLDDVTSAPDVPVAEPLSDTGVPSPRDELSRGGRPARSGGLFSGFRARQEPPAEPTPVGADEPVAQAPAPEALEPVAEVEVEPVVEAVPELEPVAEAVLELEPEPEPFVGSVPVVEVEPVVEPEPVALAEPAPFERVELAPVPEIESIRLADPPTVELAPVAGPSDLPSDEVSGPQLGAGELAALAQRPEPAAAEEAAPEPAHEPEPEPEPEPQQPALGAAALDILPGRAAARASRRSSNRGFRFGRKSRVPKAQMQPAPVPPVVPATPEPAVPIVSAQTRSETVAPRPAPAPIRPFPTEPLPVEPAPTEPTQATPGAPAVERPDVQPAPSSLFAATPAPDVGTPARSEEAPAAVAATDVSAPAPVPQPIGDVLRQRSALASEALTELSRLSTYRPAAVDHDAPAALTRRTPAAPAESPRPPASSARRARTASDVRSMLSGFQAGVERGRTSPGAHQGTDRSPAATE